MSEGYTERKTQRTDPVSRTYSHASFAYPFPCENRLVRAISFDDDALLGE